MCCTGEVYPGAGICTHPGITILTIIISCSVRTTVLGDSKFIVPNEPAECIDSRLVDTLRELGFLEDQARQALSQSNNNLAVAADVLMQPLDNTTPRVRFDESVRLDETRIRVPVMSSRGRGRGGFTFTQPPRPGQMYESQTVQTRPPAISQSVATHHDQIRDHLPPVLDKLADSLSDLKNTVSSLASGSAARESQARDAGKRLPVSGRKFDASKITQFNQSRLNSVSGLTTLCFVVVMLSLNCGRRNLKHLTMRSLAGTHMCVHVCAI